MFPLTIEGSWAHLLPWGPMDLVVSNPPYIFHQDMEQLAPEIRRCSMCGREAGLRGPGGMCLPWGTAPLGGTGREKGLKGAAMLKERLILEPTDLLGSASAFPLKVTG